MLWRIVYSVAILASATVGLTAEFERLWETHVAGDRSGWLLDERHHEDPAAFREQFVDQLRAMVASSHETALDSAMDAITKQQVAEGSCEAAVTFWEAELKRRPELEAYIGPQVNAVKGVVLVDAVPNGGLTRCSRWR